MALLTDFCGIKRDNRPELVSCPQKHRFSIPYNPCAYAVSFRGLSFLCCDALDLLRTQQFLAQMEGIHQNGEAVKLLDPADTNNVCCVYLLTVHHHADERLPDEIGVCVGRHLGLVHHLRVLEPILQEDTHRERDEQYRYNPEEDFPGEGSASHGGYSPETLRLSLACSAHVHKRSLSASLRAAFLCSTRYFFIGISSLSTCDTIISNLAICRLRV